MTDKKHTPGPWRAINGMAMAKGHVDTASCPVWGPVAYTSETEQTDTEGRTFYLSGSRYENARLIAAAPEMLEALGKALDVLRLMNARGAMWDDPDNHSNEAKTYRQVVAAIAKAKGETP